MAQREDTKAKRSCTHAVALLRIRLRMPKHSQSKARAKKGPQTPEFKKQMSNPSLGENLFALEKNPLPGAAERLETFQRELRQRPCPMHLLWQDDTRCCALQQMAKSAPTHTSNP